MRLVQTFSFAAALAFAFSVQAKEAYHNPDGTPVGGAHYNDDGTPVQGLEEPGETIDNNFLQHTIGNQRSYENKALDLYQRPSLMLLFAALRPDTNLIEILPDNRYWSEYLGVYLTANHRKGKFTQAADRSNAALWSKLSDEQKFLDSAYESDIGLVPIDADTYTDPGTADLVLMAKKLGPLMQSGKLEKVLAAASKSLKPDGELLVEDYRADDKSGAAMPKGYFKEQDVIAMMEKAGFKLERKNDTLYANPKDQRSALAANSDRFLLLFTK